MIVCYLDDSGTHDSSPLIVWGGIAGAVQFVAELEGAWKKLLDNPCDGLKPPIKAFHSHDLSRSMGEFEGYNQAERDRTRWHFRNAIHNSGLTLFGYGVDVDAWKKVFHGQAEGGRSGAERFVFGSAITNMCRAAKEHDEPISFHFDAGRNSVELVSIIKPALDAALFDEPACGYNFSPVSQFVVLQAADLIVHENYQHLCEYRKNRSASPTVHLQKLLDGSYDGFFGWFGEDELRSALAIVS